MGLTAGKSDSRLADYGIEAVFEGAQLACQPDGFESFRKLSVACRERSKREVIAQGSVEQVGGLAQVAEGEDAFCGYPDCSRIRFEDAPYDICERALTRPASPEDGNRFASPDRERDPGKRLGT